MKWYPFNPAKGSRQKRPQVNKWVLVRLAARGKGLPDAIAVGYMKNAAGDKQSPNFIVPGLGGCVLEWCDCLPDDFDPYKHNRPKYDYPHPRIEQDKKFFLGECYLKEDIK